MALAAHDVDLIRPRMSPDEADARFHAAADELLQIVGIRILSDERDIPLRAANALSSVGILSGPLHDMLATVCEIAREKYELLEGEIS